MPAIEQICLALDAIDTLAAAHVVASDDALACQPWIAVAHASQQWLRQRHLAPRDAVLLLPFAALLGPARNAFAALGGWQPRVETTLTLAASLGPAGAPEPGQCTGDPVLDRLCARTLLQRQAWAQRWAQADPAGFDRIVVSVVDAAHALRAGAQERAPADRAAFWAQARSGVAAPAGPAAAESMLLQLALEWAAAAAPAHTDCLFELRPSAWIAVAAGGPDALADAVAMQGTSLALRLVLDAPTDDPFFAVCQKARLQRIICDDFESEAQASAAEVVCALNAGRAPVALVALDRALVRRVRALLERQHIPLIDETGWVLATTRAAARVVGLLKAAAIAAEATPNQDTLLDWLKDWPAAEPAALDSLEALWRQRRHVADRDAALRLWRRAQQHLQALADGGALPLATWLQRLRESLAADGTLESLRADSAGSQVLSALHLLEDAGVAWQQAAAQARLTFGGFTSWVQATLEQMPYLPLPDDGAVVVLTPLARAFGRPFGHIVLPGADHRHLGATESPAALISDSLAVALGLDHAARRRQRQQAALALVLRADHVTLLRRRRDDEDTLTESPDVEWLLLCRQRSGLPVWPLQTWQPDRAARPRHGVHRPLPTSAAALPDLISATQVEALRACPYRFFARAVLRLDEADEIDTGLAKRDYGNWLHAVLHHFHSERVYSEAPAAQLHQAADHITHTMALDDGEMLPWRASFETFSPAYLAWCAAREAEGWYWADGESDHRRAPPELDGLRLRGRIDRLDHGPDGRQQLLDYKTGNADAFKRKVNQPLEDTQLAFYSALLGAEETLGAAYVALDSPAAPQEIPHQDVHRTAQALLDGLGDEWQRLREGAAMPALGEGAVCDTCEARGLCRRDHWEAP